MAKHRFNQKEQRGTAKGGQSAQEEFQVQLQELLKQRKYRQALDEIKKVRRSIPEIEFTPAEGAIWLLRGQQELQQSELRQAESSFRQALDLGLGEAHYWLAKALLKLNRPDAALDLLRTAFEQKILPKDYSICYLKLLLLKEDTATVEQLIVQQAKRFSAAQLHWVRGVLALKAGHHETALSSLQKIRRPVTPGDTPAAWIAYTQQALGDWKAAATTLDLGRLQARQSPLIHPILERLVTFQQVNTGRLMPNPTDLRHTDWAYQEAVVVLETLQLIDQGNIHDAGHVLLKLGPRTSFPELDTLRRPLLTLAGQQALEQRQPECAEALWQPLMAEQPFNLQLAVNLNAVLEVNDSHQERQRLLTRLLKWLEQEAKKHPQDWPDAKLKPNLAKVHCYLADTWMALNRERTALGSLQQAERLCPESPEVIGRKGLAVAMEEKYEEAATMLTQALEGGCRYEEVYGGLLNCWRELGNKQALNEARRRFGKYFGDVNVEPDVEVLPWIDALSTQSYPFFSRLIQAEDRKDPAINACRTFVDAVQGFPTSGGRVSLQQEAAVQQWEVLLQGLSAKEQIPVLQAIALSIQLFTKREKGVAALVSRYLQQLTLLSDQHPEAQEARLVVLAVKESQPQKIQLPLRQYLDTKPQPGTALAKIQLQVRRFTQAKTLLSFIDEALRRDSQNPILLLAKATTYPNNSRFYEDFRQQGFELARRLQDAKALQAFREEQAFLNACQTQELLPDPDDFDSFDQSDIEGFIENMIRKIFGKQIPPNELKRIMPELKQRMLETMPDFEHFEDEEDFDIFSIPRTKKRKRGSQDL